MLVGLLVTYIVNNYSINLIIARITVASITVVCRWAVTTYFMRGECESAFIINYVNPWFKHQLKCVDDVTKCGIIVLLRIYILG